ncbi:HAMP domain-containing protein [Spirochaeta cellobiosiphila]|uniref:HAMP domain-containing protein n=1 Tax=Spirochaeta cellobiosiphila TaxID=504483 RepID=UPI0003FF4D00|nr:HAMP domain-containing protein [Spirochaeta cellobiosiphila]
MNEKRILILFRNRLIAWGLLSVLGSFLVFSLVMGIFYFTNDITGDSVYRDWNILFTVLLLNNLIIMLFLIGTGIYLANRIVSPIKRISRSLETIVNGKKPQRIDIKEPDIFTELVQNINLLIEKTDQ